MSESHSPSSEIQFVSLTPEQAEILAQSPETVHDLGHTAMEGVEIVGVIAPTEASPAQLINLSNDPGTSISVSGETPRAQENLEKYGSAEDAFAKLEAEKQSKDTMEAADSISLAEAAEKAGFSDVLRRYDALEDTVHTNNKLMRMDVGRAVDDLRRLQAGLKQAAEEGPWSGNYLRNHPALTRRLTTVAEELAAQVNKNRNRVETQQSDVTGYRRKMSDVSAEVLQQTGAASRETRAFAGTLDDVGSSLQKLARNTIASEAVDRMQYAVQTLSNMGYDTHLTAEDAMSMVSRLSNSLEEMQQKVAGGYELRMVSEKIDTLKRIMRTMGS